MDRKAPSRAPDWEGDAGALVAEANRKFAQAKAPALRLNQRLLRDYVQRGIVARPQRRGKAAIYSARHLAQLLAARRLLADGWPLAKIAEHMRTLSIGELAGLADPPGAGLAEDAAPYDAHAGGKMNTVTVTSKGELTLSKTIVDALGVRPGDRVSVEELPGGQVQLKAAPKGKISDLFGMFHTKGRKPLSIEDMNRIIALGWAGQLKLPRK